MKIIAAIIAATPLFYESHISSFKKYCLDSEKY